MPVAVASELWSTASLSALHEHLFAKLGCTHKAQAVLKMLEAASGERLCRP